MALKTSRRQILVAGAAAVAASASGSQDQKTATQSTVADVELQLAKPLEEPAKKLLPAAVRNIQAASLERMKFKLPENSEPCTIYVSTPKRAEK